jgi:hypothetical protein
MLAQRVVDGLPAARGVAPGQADRLADRVADALRDWDIAAVRALVRDTLALAPDLPQVVRARELNAAILAQLG